MLLSVSLLIHYAAFISSLKYEADKTTTQPAAIVLAIVLAILFNFALLMTLGTLYWRSREKRDRRLAEEPNIVTGTGPLLSAMEEGGVAAAKGDSKVAVAVETGAAPSSSSREGLMGVRES